MTRRLRVAAALCAALAVVACAPVPHSDTASRTMIADTTLPPMKTFGARAPRSGPVSNAALQRDFLELSFQMESGTPLPVLTRFEGPVTLRVAGTPPATLLPDLRALIARLRSEAGIDISLTDRSDANIVVEAVPRRTIQKVLPQAACFVAPNVSSLAEFRKARRSPHTNWATLRTRQSLAIILPRDVSPQEIRDCLHEELAQALGPLNDLYRLPDSVFNDDNVHTILTGFDMMILRTTYAPELASGMSREEVEAVLPAVLSRINPGGGRGAKAPEDPTPQAYTEAIQKALGPGSDPDTRRAAANTALRIARTARWQDTRLGFAHYAKGRVLQSTDPDGAALEFARADAVYARSRTTRLHRAYVSSHLAAHALASGDPARAQQLVTPHVPAARDAQNAALLATLQMIRAESLRAEGKTAQSDTLRLDSLGWARYGFGADWAVQTKLREISALNPNSPPV